MSILFSDLVIPGPEILLVSAMEGHRPLERCLQILEVPFVHAIVAL